MSGVYGRFARLPKTDRSEGYRVMNAGVHMLGTVLHLIRVGTTAGERLVEL